MSIFLKGCLFPPIHWRYRVNTFQVLEAKFKETPMISLEGVKLEKGERVTVEKQLVSLIESDPKELTLSR